MPLLVVFFLKSIKLSKIRELKHSLLATTAADLAFGNFDFLNKMSMTDTALYDRYRPLWQIPPTMTDTALYDSGRLEGWIS